MFIQGANKMSTNNLFKRFYKDYENAESIFRGIVLSNINYDSIILNAGCGSNRATPFSLKGNCKMVVGVDINKKSLIENNDIDHAVIAELEHLPFKPKSFNTIVSRWVFEHLKDPAECVKCFSDIIVAKGIVHILTPNLLHYGQIAIKLIPFSFQRRFLIMQDTDPEHFLFPTFYRANTPWKIKAIFSHFGFNNENVVTIEGPPNYLNFSSITTMVGILYERIVNKIDKFSIFRSVMIGNFQKI